jgi:predicted Zn-dependent peptidase
MGQIFSRTLRCGMPLLVEPMSGVRSLGLTWLVPAGSAADSEDRQGLSALWSELLFRGAGDLDSRGHADALDRLGASRSADVGTRYFRLGATMIGEKLTAALPLLVDMIRRPRFDAESIEPARDLALQSLDSLKDDPQERAVIACRHRHYPSPINRSGLGTPEGLAAATRADIVEGWAARARPGRSIFAVAGAVDPDALASQMDKLLAGWEGTTPEPVRDQNPPRGYAHERDETNQVQVILMHDAPPEPDPASLPEKVVVNVLSGGMSGRLFTEVREKRGLCYSVSAGYSSDRDYGSILAYVGTTPERAQESLDVLAAELQRIHDKAGAVTPEEFARTIVGMKSRLIFSGESSGSRAAAIASDQHRLGRPRTLDELAGQIDSITLDQVNAYLARRALGRVTIQTLGPAALKPPL